METLEKNHYTLKSDDILDLIQKQQNYPIKKLFPKLEETLLELGMVTTQFKDMFTKAMQRRERKIQALSLHDLFKQLSGNPTSIVFFANAVANKFKPDQTLTQLYQTAILDGEEA